MRALPIPALLKPAPLRRRLWQGAGALAIFIATMAIGNLFSPKDKALTRRDLGQDFIAFYTAGTFAERGHFEQIYNLDAVRQFQHQVAREADLDMGNSFGPFWNPPFYAWMFAPLSHLPFGKAVTVWTGINLMALLGALLLLCQMLPQGWLAGPAGEGWVQGPRDWRNWMLVPLIVLVSTPLIQSLGHGQNTCLSLFIVCLLVKAWRGKQAELAGILCGLLFYKPQLAAVLATILTINLGVGAIVGMLFTGIVLFGIASATMPGAIDIYLHQLPANIHFMQVEHTYLWERHVTLKALWRLLFQGREAGEARVIVQLLTYATAGWFGALLLRAAFRSRRKGDEPWSGETAANSRDRLIAATIVTTPLLMPFYFDYDLLLLAVPGVLIAGEFLRSKQERTRFERFITRTFIALYLWLMVNPGLARMSEVNGTVILLGILAVQLVLRASRRTELEDLSAPVALPELYAIYRRAA